MTITEVIIIAVIVGVSAYTSAQAGRGRGDLTVSATMRRWSGRWWVIPVGWGALAGHWWGPRTPAWWPGWTGWVLAGIGALGIGLCAWGRWRVERWWVWWILGAVGAVLGAALWPLTRGG